MSGEITNTDNIIKYVYKFIFSNGEEKEFNIQLDSNSLTLIKENGNIVQ